MKTTGSVSLSRDSDSRVRCRRIPGTRGRSGNTVGSLLDKVFEDIIFSFSCALAGRGECGGPAHWLVTQGPSFLILVTSVPHAEPACLHHLGELAGFGALALRAGLRLRPDGRNDACGRLLGCQRLSNQTRHDPLMGQ